MQSIGSHHNAVKLGDKPNNSLRDGFAPITLDTGKKHPVEEIQKNHLRRQEDMHLNMMVASYGTHAGLRAKMERTILGNVHRLPGMHSSFLGLSTVMGLDDTIEFEDYLNIENPEDPMKNKSMHEIMEARMGLL